MSESASQIFSNFKLFSNNESSNDVRATIISQIYSFKYYFAATFLITIALLSAFYFKQAEMISLWNDAVIQFNSILEKILLSAHLSSSGELLSVYVPKNFYFLSDDANPATV